MSESMSAEQWWLKKTGAEREERAAEMEAEAAKLNPFDKLLHLEQGDVEKVMEYLREEVQKAKRRYDFKHGGPSIGAQVMKEAEEHAQDDLGRVLYLDKHFDEIPEPERSEIYTKLAESIKNFSEKAQTKIAMLSFRCESGKEILLKRGREVGEKFPEYKKAFTGED